MTLEEVLSYSFRHFFALDHSNAAVHCAKVRYSPITFRLAEQISLMHQNGSDLPAAVATVMKDRGSYPEDTGRPDH
jgi:hypothetical protein